MSEQTRKVCEICDYCVEEPCRVGTDDSCSECDRILAWVESIIGKPDKDSRKHAQIVRNQLIREQLRRLRA